MGINYTELLAEVKTVIEENGRAMTLVKQNDTPDDADVPWKDLTGSNTSTPFIGVVGTFEWMEQGDSIVRRGDKKVLAHADLGVDLDEYDQLIDGATTWNIIGMDKVSPGTKDLMYIMQVRL